MSAEEGDVSHIWTRREVIALLAGSAAVSIAGCGTEGNLFNPWSAGSEMTEMVAGCVVSPEQTAGPYFIDERSNRSDIRKDPSDGSVRPGVPLELSLTVSQIVKNECKPLPGAVVDIWHCDALGVYSDVDDPRFGSSKGRKFLRGFQVTDASGKVNFTTVYPGWYPGRAVHIHYMIRTDPKHEAGHEFASQLYFDEGVTDKVHGTEPYRQKGKRDMLNSNDWIYRGGGKELTLALTPKGKGYAAAYNVGFLIK